MNDAAQPSTQQLLDAEELQAKVDRINAERIAKLERTIAYESARSDIERHCHCRVEYQPGRPVSEGVSWYSTSKGSYHTELRSQIERGIEYLELRGLLERHPKHSSRVRVLDQPVEA